MFFMFVRLVKFKLKWEAWYILSSTLSDVHNQFQQVRLHNITTHIDDYAKNDTTFV